MSEKSTATDINEVHRKFSANQDHIGRYGDAIVAATDALTKYDEYGHGRFAWLAYKSVREAERLWPAYREAMIAYVSTWGNGQEVRLSTEVLDTLRERVLCILDGVVGDLLDLGDTSSERGHAAIKKALKIDGRKAPVNSVARYTDAQIVESMMMMYRHLASLQERYESGQSRMPGPPPASATHIKGIVAKQTGASVSKIDAVWRDYLCDGQYAEYCRELIEHCKRIDKELKSKGQAKPKSPRRSPARPAADHVWRTKIRGA